MAVKNEKNSKSPTPVFRTLLTRMIIFHSTAY